MSSERQAEAYLEEAELTLKSATAIYESAEESNDELWADVVKNGYDSLEQAVSAAIASRGESIPRSHPGKINTFIDLFEPDELEEMLLNWLSRRSSTQYVDIRSDEINVPHRNFDRDDAEQILQDAETVIEFVSEQLELSEE